MTSNHETTTNNEHDYKADSKTDEFVVVEGDGSPATTRFLPTEPTTPPSSPTTPKAEARTDQLRPTEASSPEPRAKAHVKLALRRAGGVSEVRRVEHDASTYGALVELAARTFGELAGARLSYVDEDGDDVVVTSDAELDAAASFFAARGATPKFDVAPAPATLGALDWTTTDEKEPGFEGRPFGDGKRVVGETLAFDDGREAWPGKWLTDDRFVATAAEDEARGIAQAGTWLGVFDKEDGVRTAFFRGEVGEEALLALEPTRVEPWSIPAEEVFARIFGLKTCQQKVGSNACSRNTCAPKRNACSQKPCAPKQPTVGDVVVLHSLARARYNGAKAVVREERADRVIVELLRACGAEQLLSVKRANCRAVRGPDPRELLAAAMLGGGFPFACMGPVLVSQGG